MANEVGQITSKSWIKIPSKLRLGIKVVLVFSLILGGVLLALTLKPVRGYNPNPILNSVNGNYNQALEKAKSIQAQEVEQGVNPVCQTQVLEHGQKVRRVAVLYHGFTNCPAQYSILGKQIYDLGYNVIIPRMPHHGLNDRLNDDLKNLTAQELVDNIQIAVDLASGLGEEVMAFGISGGSVMAAWAGYHFPAVKTVFVAAPLFAPADFNDWQLNFIINLLELIPNQNTWWDDNSKENIEGPKYAYPRFSSKAIRPFMELSADLYSKLKKNLNQQSGKKLVLLLGENDPAINNTVARKMIELWGSSPDTTLIQYQFPANLGLGHDFIDPNQKTAKIDIVYPLILKLMQD